MADISLSTVKPDRDDLVEQLKTALLTSNAWKDRLTTSTGQTLIDFIAAVGAYDQFSIESAFQEVFPQSAKNAESVYAAAEFMGVRTNRKLSASVFVSLQTDGAPVTLPVFTQFTGGGTYWYNKVPLTVTSTPTTFTLYQGKVVSITTTGLGTDFQAFVSQEKAFVVHDQDVKVKINGVNQFVTTDGLWSRPGQDGVQNKTLPDGKLLLLFGNSIYGSLPQVNDTIEITYVVTLGEDGNNVPLLSKAVSVDSFPTVGGTATSQPSGGGSESPYLVYKNVTPALWGAFNSSVTAAQYKRLPLQYPGVLDAMTFSQREVNPRALSWMNVIKVCLLTETPFNSTQWNDFEVWFLRNTMYAPRIFREDPVPVNVSISATLYCANYAVLSDVQQKASDALDDFFRPRQGVLGLDVYLSDIYDVILAADANIRYVKLHSPTTDIVLSSLNVTAPVITSSGGGSLTPGLYDYAISVVSSLGGETAPAYWTSFNVTLSGSKNTLVWNPVVNALQYKVWGRITPTSLGLIATVSGNTTTYVDTGAVTPTGTVPSQSTVATYYPRLVSKTLDMQYSTRTNELA